MTYLTSFLQRHLLAKNYLAQAEQHFQPLLKNIISQVTHKKKQPISSPVFVGINGCQGSGKSTLADYLATTLNHLSKPEHKLSAIFFSLDDFYLSQIERQQLAKNIHPLFKTRGVPGTHNIELLAKTLAALTKNQGVVSIPVFDKVTDNPKPKRQWQRVTLPVDVVIIEGWCWGASSQTEQDLIAPINELERNFDSNGEWRSYVNQQLKQYYQPLYNYMELWVMLKAPSFACVKQWRLEQEVKQVKNKLNASNHQGMNATEIEDFIQYFQRLTEYSLSELTNVIDFVFELDVNRAINNTWLCR
ncbi:MAG: kinase [Gammaproteobacteria bacterium]|nr:MAG: kinase [Gammaproteobacteria bacterium]